MLIEIQQARPGMIIAEDICHPKGGFLAKKQQSLSTEMITVLLRLGIKKIYVQGTDPPEMDQNTLSHQQKSPGFELILQQDLMSASLIINPPDTDPADISAVMINQLLSAKKVVHGIDEELINSTVTQWNKQKTRLEIKNLAIGTPSQPAVSENYHITVPYISNQDLIEKIRTAHYYWEITKFIPPNVKKVSAGTVLAEKQIAKPAIPGVNILGEIIYTDQTITQKLSITESVISSDDGKFLLAKNQGIPYLCNDTIGVLFLSFDGSIDINVQNDKMAAMLIVHEPAEGGSMPNEKQIQSIIKNHGITFGINEMRILELLKEFSRKEYPKNPVTIAEGKPPFNGENGSVKLLFDIETSLKPRLNPDGSVDYKNISIIKAVEKGQKLAQLIPPSKGIPGQTIFGQNLPSLDGTPVTLPVGPNTEIDPQDPNFLIASTDGFVRFCSTVIEVSEGLIISGDIDFSTGNINYSKDVVVNGDIKSGFDINCGGDLQVAGTIEDCKITISGNLLCRLGFIGQGKGMIEADGNVNLNFTKNQSIKCKKNVNIAKEAINSNIFAKDTITVHGKPLSIAGGVLTAGKSISLYTVGNQSGIKTILEVGIDFTLKEELEKKEALLFDLTNGYAKLQENYKKYEKMYAIRKQLPPKEKFLWTKIIETMTKYKQQMEKTEQQVETIKSRIYQLTTAFIKVEHSAMPGTLFKFGERHYLVKEEIVGPKTVRLINHEIKVL